MKKTLTYDYDTMVYAAGLLGSMQLTGIENFRKMSKVADILDSGELSEENEEMVIKRKHGTPPEKQSRPRNLPENEMKSPEEPVEGANNDT